MLSEWKLDLDGDYQIEDGVVVDWTLSMDSNPFVNNNFTIINLTGSTQIYSLTTTLGIMPVIPNGLMRGAINVSFLDNNGDGAILGTSGAPIYQGVVDGTVERTLWDALMNFTTSFNDAASINFGFSTREGVSQSIDMDIGIKIMFSLTAGDSAAVTSNFDVVPVPLPAAMWLFGSGLLGLAGVTRRKVV